MSGIHAPFSRVITLNPSSPKTSGGSFDLGDGQIGLFITESGSRGAKAVSGFAKINSKYFLEIGTGITSNQGGMSSKGLRTHWFSPKDVKEVVFSAAKAPTQALVYLGYDGLDTNKTLKLKPGEAAEVSLTLTGEVLAYYGFKDGKYTGTFVVKADDPDECQETCLNSPCYDRTLALIDQIKNREIRNGVKLSHLIDANPVTTCSPDRATTATANFYCLSLCDKGDDAALGLVQAQVTGYKVERTDRTGTTSTYKILGGVSAPSEYIDWTAAIAVDCDGECPDGYTSIGSGYYVIIQSDDAGADVSATISAASEATFGAAATSVTKIGKGASAGKYLVVFAEEIDTDDATGVIFVKDVTEFKDGCILTTPTETEWTACGTCETSFDYYYIDLDDDDCGDSRIAELRKAFPSYTIVDAAVLTDGVPDGTEFSELSQISEIVESDVLGDCRRRYFTTVTTNVVCDECHPDQFKSTKPDAFEFEEWHKYVIDGGKVASVEEGDAVEGRTEGTYEGVSGETDNNGTGATFDVEVDSAGAATATVVEGGKGYQVGDTITISDDDLGAGGAEDLVLTINTITTPSEDLDCVCGIMFRGKDIDLCPETNLSDGIGTIKSQIEIQVSGGELLGTKIGYKYKTGARFPVTRVSRAFNGTGWGKDYWTQEKEAYDYGLDIVSDDSSEERFFKGTQSKLETCKQYDTITVKIKNTALSQAFSQTKTEYIRYIFVIPTGTKHIFDGFFNTVASGNLESGGVSDQ